MSRLATFTFAAATAVAVGCVDDGGGVMALYGAPAEDAGSLDAGDEGEDAGEPNDDGGAVALYGLPIEAGVDGGTVVDAGPQDDGGAVALYGLPAEGGVQPPYGLPPDAG